jgi:hypothetical protein
MNSNTPIYYTTITLEIVKLQTVIETVVVPEVVVKGFTTQHIIQYNMNHILRKLANHYKLGKDQLAKVSKIEYLKQLGFGIDY